jgi:dipicolinate synthase subunit A
MTLTQAAAQAGEADCLILPIPPADAGGLLTAPLGVQRAGVEQLVAQMGPGQWVCAGGDTELLRRREKEQGFTLANYLSRPELKLENAIPTAEGAIRIAMEELPRTIFGIPALVVGCGACGYALARRLDALGAEVTVTARNQADFARIRGEGWKVGETGNLAALLAEKRLVVNTVPAPVLGEAELRLLPQGALLIDLSSGAGGVDWRAAERLGIKAIHALGLPGKFAPETAAECLKRAIYHCMQEGEP